MKRDRVEKIGWSDYNGTEISKLAASRTHFLLGENLEVTLWIESHSIDESPEKASMSTRKSEIQTEKPEAHSCWDALRHSRLQEDCSVILNGFFLLHYTQPTQS